MNHQQVLLSANNTNIGTTVSYVMSGPLARSYASIDGLTWAEYSQPGSTIEQTIYANGQWISVGNSGTILTSSDGKNWTQQTSGTTNTLQGVAWNSSLGLYAVVGYQTSLVSRILTSPDGVTWTSRTAPTGIQLLCVTSTPTGFCASGRDTSAGQTIDVTSTDGITWTRNVIDAAGNTIVSVLHNGTNRVMLSANCDLYIGNTSYTIPNSLGDANEVIWTGSRYIVVGGNTSNITMTLWHSTTGTGSWTTVQILSTANRPAYSVVWDGTKYLVAGTNGIFATSTNLSTWDVGTAGFNTLRTAAYKP